MTIGLALGYTPKIFAQDSGSDEFTLEEITVTAQKREENQQKVAIAMQTFSGDELRELGYNDLDEIISQISNAFVNTAGDGMRVSLRGMADTIVTMGALNDMSISTPTVAVNVDGVYSSRRKSGSGLYDMERVEVLYGPQSTLYATSSPGGIVNIVTAEPKTDKYEAGGTLEYGNYNNLQMQGMVNAPVSDKIALRAAFNTSVRDGYLANGADDDDSKSARLKALFKPSDRLSFILTGELTNRGGHGYSGTAAFISESDVDDPWDNSNVQGPGGGAQPPRYHKMKKVFGHFEWDFGLGSLTVIPSYLVEDEFATMSRANPFTGETTTSSIDREGSEKGAELRMASSSDSRIKWILGANHYKSDTNEMNMPDTGYYEYRVVTQTTDAFFGNITYAVSDNIRINAGARKSDDETYLSEQMLKSAAETGAPEDFLVVMEAATKYSEPDFKIGVEYDVSENSMLYADWSSSYRAVGYVLKQMDPERIYAYTVGSKNRFFGNKVQVNVSAFYYDYKDKVEEFGRVADPDNNRATDLGTVTNGQLRKYGVDVEASTIITKNDRLDFSISYLNSEYTELEFDFVNPRFQDQDYTGKPETFCPDWTLTAKYSHNFNLPNGGTLTARLDSRYQSKLLVTFADKYQEGYPGMAYEDYFILYDQGDFIWQEAYHMSNLSLIYAHPDGKWTLNGYVKNLEDYAVKKNIMKGSMMIGPPRTYGAILSVRF